MVTREPHFALPQHGGNIPWAARTFGIPPQRWIDLSTGISPWAYPIPPIPEAVWRQLPYDLEPLLSAAAHYYGCAAEHLCEVPGTQFAIEHLPRLFPPRPVALPLWGYAAHRRAWQQHHCPVQSYNGFDELLQGVSRQDIPYVVIIRPNNPSAEFFSCEQVKQLENSLVAKHGNNYLLIIDEAFIDLFPASSFVHSAPQNNTLILRSIGKFFGLAGLRLGFIIAQPPLMRRFATAKGQWAINSPAIYIAQRALRDTRWFAQQSLRIVQQSRELNHFLLERRLARKLAATKSTGLFTTVFGEAEELLGIFTQLAKAGVLVRYIPGAAAAALRFGLPGEHAEECFNRIEGLLNA